MDNKYALELEAKLEAALVREAELEESIQQLKWTIEGLTAIIQNTEGKIVLKKEK